MKGYNNWSYQTYRPFDESFRDEPVISRLIPYETSVLVECTDKQKTVFYKERQGLQWNDLNMGNSCSILIEGLKERCEYEIYVKDVHGNTSGKRIFFTANVPGTAIDFLHRDDKQYIHSGRFLCSPSIVKLPDGRLLASCDLFDIHKQQNLTRIFRSNDNGESWRFITEMMPCFWGKLFWHNTSLYMLGVSTEYGDLLIGKSDDMGENWSAPATILRGSCTVGKGCHRAPCPILNANGKLYTSLEYGAWTKGGFSATVLFADKDSDLMKAENWNIAKPLKLQNGDGIEGSVVQAPNGEILDILRWKKEQAVVLKLNEDTCEMEYKTEISFPLGHTKFEILRHDDGWYYAIGNTYPARCVLAIFRSKDLENWEWVEDIINYEGADPEKVAFQYPSVYIDGQEMVILSRTAMNGAENFHNSNYITFHRMKI